MQEFPCKVSDTRRASYNLCMKSLAFFMNSHKVEIKSLEMTLYFYIVFSFAYLNQ